MKKQIARWLVISLLTSGTAWAQERPKTWRGVNEPTKSVVVQDESETTPPPTQTLQGADSTPIETLSKTPRSPGAPARVFVYSQQQDPSGFVDSGTERISDSVNDLKEALSTKRRLRLVPTRDEADLVIEVLRSGGLAMNSSTTITTNRLLLPGVQSKTRQDVQPVLTARLTVPGTSYSKEIGYTKPAGLSMWKPLANAIAKVVDQWVKDNDQRLR